MNYYNNTNNYKHGGDLENHKRSDKIKWIVVFASLALLFILVIAALAAAAHAGGKAEENAESGEDPERTYGMVIGESRRSDGMLFECSVIPAAAYAAYGVPRYVETAYTVKATLSPEVATNKSVDWSVAWTDATSEWADGKDVTEYISLSPSGLTCTVTCLQAFGEQATLKCSWAENEDINAVCMLEYAERIVSLDYEHNEIAYTFTSSGSSYEYAGESGEYDAFGYGIEPVYGDGTLADTFSYGYFVSFSSELVEAMREQGFETYEPDMAYNIEKKMNEEYFGASGAFFGLFVLTDDSARQVVSDKLSGASGGAYDRFAGVMRSLSGERLFSIVVVCTGEYSGFTGTCDFSAQASVYATDVTDIRLSDGSVIF